MSWLVFKFLTIIWHVRCFFRGHHMYFLKHENGIAEVYECDECWHIISFAARPKKEVE